MQGSILTSATFSRNNFSANNTQRQEFAQALLKAKESTTISADSTISREVLSSAKSIGTIDSSSQKSFSYQMSSEMVSKRFQERDFSIFVPPSALNAYKSE